MVKFMVLHEHYSALILQDIGEHLTTIHLKCCDRGKRCLYEGRTPPGGFPNSWVIISQPRVLQFPCFMSIGSLLNNWSLCLGQNGATYCTSELTILKNNEIHMWDRGFDDDGNQVSFVAHIVMFIRYLGWVSSWSSSGRNIEKH